MKIKNILLIGALFSLLSITSNSVYAATAVFQEGVNGYVGGEDNEIDVSTATTVYSTTGSTYSDRIGVKFCGSRCNNMLLRFKNLTGVTGAISNITLTLTESAKQGSNVDFLYAHKINRADWITGETTWSNYKTASAWTLPGGDFGTALVTTSALPSAGTINFDLGTNFTLTELEQNGIMITSGISIFDFVWFHSNEAVTPADRPKLTITYVGAPDSTPPTVSITNPVNTATISGTVSIAATANDNDAVAGVTFKVDGSTLGVEDTTSPYTINLDTTTLSNGAHTITATARDVANNETVSSSVSVTVNNVIPAPTISFSASSSSVTSGNSTTLTWSSANATSCTASGGWSGTKATSGSQSTGALTATTTFTLSCTGVSGTAIQSVTVTVPTNITPVNTGLKMDLTYVNQSSPEFIRFKSLVDRAIAGNPDYGFSPTDAALMYKITGDVQYADFAIAYVDSCPNSFEFANYGTPCGVVRAEATITGGGVPLVAGDSYLEAGEIIGSLALVYDWAGNRMTQQQKTRWEAYANQTIYNIWNPTLASWGGVARPWTGWSINNPGNNYYYSFLQATMYWALASRDATLLSFVRNQKIQPLLDYYAQIPGGGSLEGTGYGTAHMGMFFLHKVWKDSTGEDTANANSHLTDSIRFWLHATLPNRAYYAPVGDLSRSSFPDLFDYHRRLVLVANHLTNNTTSKDLASWWLKHISVTSMSRAVDSRWDLFSSGTYNGSTPVEALSYHADGVGRIFTRTGWSTSDLWMSFAAGKYNESHAHQDQGSFTLANNAFLAVSNNIYSSSGINQTTDYQNVLRFSQGSTIIPQVSGTESIMTVNQLNTNGEIDVTGNITPAYGGNAAVQNWTRNVKFIQRKLTVTDNFAVSGGTQAVFQIGVPAAPVVNGNNITAGTLNIRVVSPVSPTVNVVNQEGRYRLDISGGTNEYIVELSDQALSSNPAPSVSFAASPTSISSGSATLTWSSTNSTSCIASGGWSGTKTLSGTESVSPTTTTTYTLTCTGAGGTTVQNTTVTFNSVTPAPTVSFSSSPSSITAGGTSTLAWSSTDATSCTASGGWSGGTTTSGTQSVAPTVTTSYSLSCAGPGGTSTQTATITVTNVPISSGGGGGGGYVYPSPLANTIPSATTSTPTTNTQLSLGLATSSKIKTTLKLNVRSGASLTNQKLCSQSAGALGTIVEGPIAKNGYQWWKINYDNGCDGWSVQDHIFAIEAKSTSGVITQGSKIKTTLKLNVRSGASLTNQKLCSQSAGALGTIVEGPIAKNGYQWWKINYDNGCDGWSVQDHLLLN